MFFYNGQGKSQALSQTTDTVLMISPVAFDYNAETAVNNAFQSEDGITNTAEKAREESDAYIKMLEDNGITVIAVEDTKEPHTPDSVFPNNWFSTHEDGTLVLYPMFAENRRLERKPAALEAIDQNFNKKKTVDLTHYEEEGLFLEGTGSMVLDRVNKIVYACESPRTNRTVLEDFCKQLGYTPVIFQAVDADGTEIYHTNVMMHVGSEVAVVCLDSIKDDAQRAEVKESLENTGKEIMEISFDQMNHFAGNMLELHNKDGEPCLIMSQAAYKSLTWDQIELLDSKMTLITPDLECIEQNGGGSARCMLAEIF
ncbi:MAG: amidinotransferase [Firmicutes bacterium]|nr:amidinotransferase [Bacillota bacterium]